MERVPLTVVTGFLGAGKTTIVNGWLGRYPRGDVAVIVNEVGAIGIDGELLGERARTVVEITGGCICCATHAELVRALSDLASREPAPKRIFVETSGAASPAGVLRAIFRGDAADAIRLDGIVTVVDARRTELLAAHDLAAEQVGYADVLVLTRADACTDLELEAAESALASHNGTALVTVASRGVLRDRASLDELLAQRSSDLKIVTPSARAPHDAIESVALTFDGELDEELFAEWVERELARFEGRLLRMKGILAVRGLDERMILQGVADQVEVEFGRAWGEEPRTSRIVLVGFGLDRESLEPSFRACAADARAEP